MERINLRVAAKQTARSVTTLRRYIRSGRLHADKLPGRFGPEYFVTAEQLKTAGLDATDPGSIPSSPAKPESAMVARSAASLSLASAPPDRLLRDSVPVFLFQDLQLKHEQLLVQYGMVRAGGLRVLTPR